MELSELINEINELADEQETTAIVLGFINDAIAKINIECDANFPSLSLQGNEPIPFPEKWQRTLIIPFGVGRLKQKDSSQFEYTDAYNEFLANLEVFKEKYEIPEIYKDSNSTGSYGSDIFQNPPLPYFRF